MLLSKPKKSYKSVSKTDLIKDQEEQKVDIFDYEEMNITQDAVSLSTVNICYKNFRNVVFICFMPKLKKKNYWLLI